MYSSRRSRPRHRQLPRAATALAVFAAGAAFGSGPAFAAGSTKPATPSDLHTSPTTSCRGGTIVGDGDVSLYATVSDPGGGTVGSRFQVWPQGHPGDIVASSDPTQLTSPSGTAAVLAVGKAALESAAAGAITEFDWRVQASDTAGATSNWSTICRFAFDPTRPEAPSVGMPAPGVIGRPTSATVTAPSTGTLPSAYSYQLDNAAPVTVAADSRGGATLTFTPPRFTNTLSVTSLSPGGNFGGTTTINFTSAEPSTPFADGDLTGDGVPDLLAVGNQNGLPPGLWLAAGRTAAGKSTGDGYVATPPADIGVNGTGFNTYGSPSDFDGATAITGHFTGSPFQDVLVYFPGTGGGAVYPYLDNGQPISTASGSETSISPGTFQDFNGDNPSQLANAGSISGSGSTIPDLIGTAGDPANGYALDLYQAGAGAGFYNEITLNATTPDGTADWNNWTIATMQLPKGNGTSSTAMYLWKRSTGELDLWENLAADPNTGNLTYTAYPVASNWNTGASLTLQAADINGDGTPDLWTVGQAQTLTANLFSGLSTTAPASLTQVTETLTAGSEAPQRGR